MFLQIPTHLETSPAGSRRRGSSSLQVGEREPLVSGTLFLFRLGTQEKKRKEITVVTLSDLFVIINE